MKKLILIFVALVAFSNLESHADSVLCKTSYFKKSSRKTFGFVPSGTWADSKEELWEINPNLSLQSSFQRRQLKKLRQQVFKQLPFKEACLAFPQKSAEFVKDHTRALTDSLTQDSNEIVVLHEADYSHFLSSNPEKKGNSTPRRLFLTLVKGKAAAPVVVLTFLDKKTGKPIQDEPAIRYALPTKIEFSYLSNSWSGAELTKSRSLFKIELTGEEQETNN